MNQPDSHTAPYARLVRLDGITPERLEWLWPGRLPVGKLVVLDGDPGAGKSTMVLDWAARVSTGAPWPDGRPNPGPGGVVILSAEDGLADTIRPRLDAAQADPSRIVAMTEIIEHDDEGREHHRPPSLPSDLDHLARAISEHTARLVIVDVLMAYLNGKVDAHRDQDVRGVLHRLAAIAERHRCVIVCLRHLRKAGGSAIYAGGGSIGIIGAARAAFIATADPEDETGNRRMLACAKINIAAAPRTLGYQLVSDERHGCARIQWLSEDDRTADQLLAPALETTTDSGDRDEVAAWITAYLLDNGGEASAEDIFKAAAKDGYGKDQLKRAKRRARVRSEKTGMDAGWMWRLPEGSEGSRTENPAPFAPFVLPSESAPEPLPTTVPDPKARPSTTHTETRNGHRHPTAR